MLQLAEHVFVGQSTIGISLLKLETPYADPHVRCCERCDAKTSAYSISGISCLQPLCPESLFNPLSQNPSPSSLSSKHTFRNPLPKSPSPESQPAAPVMAMPHLQSTVCPFLPLLPSPPRSGSAPSPDEPAGAPSPPGIFFSHETLCPANPVFGRY